MHLAHSFCTNLVGFFIMYYVVTGPPLKDLKKKSLKKLVHSVHPTSTSVELLDGLGNFWFIIYNLETDT